MREHVVIVGLAAVLGAVASLLALRDRPRSAAQRALVVLLLSGTWWSAGSVVMLLASEPGEWVQGYLLLEPGLATACSTLFYLSVAMVGARYARTWWTWALVAVDPAFTLVVIAVPVWHDAFLVPVAGAGRTQLVPGPLMWVHAAWSGLLVLGGIVVMLVGRAQTVTGHRGRYIGTVGGAGVPAFAALVVLAVTRDAVLVPVAASTGFLLGLVVWSLDRRAGLGEINPVDVHQVVGALGDAVVVVDQMDRVVLVNPAARAMIEDWLGHRVEPRALARTTSQVVLDVLHAEGLVHLPTGAVLDVRHTPVMSGGSRSASVITVRDVTEVESLRAELADLAERDGLTGLRNRRYLERVLPGLVTDAAAGGVPLVAAMIDIDHFKAVNDRFGHAVGDRLLVATAGALSARLRGDDVLVRFGGEEFLALLPGARVAEMADRAEAWRRACAAVAVDAADGVTTVSIGLAEVGPGDGVDDLLRAADGAMYAAKAAGRNRVEVHAGAAPAPSGAQPATPARGREDGEPAARPRERRTR